MSNSNVKKGQRSGPEEQRLQGHWLLAKMGKRVLRPGGVELTERLIEKAAPKGSDRIVEFGPGVGKTAELLLSANPVKYIGVDPSSSKGTDELQKVLAEYPQADLLVSDAKQIDLEDGSADLVVGEAMLTMQSEKDKRQIMSEAYRILAPGGRYAIHELGFTPDDVPENVKNEIAKTLSRTIKVGARPLTSTHWQELLRETGFEISYVGSNGMKLLEPQRFVKDEGLLGALRFVYNVIRNPAARERILAMRSVFREYQENMNAIAIVARKPR